MVLAEIYITFNVMAFIIFILGMEKRDLIYPLLSMVLFFSLAVAGASITSLFTNDLVTSIEAMTINFSFGILSFVFSMFLFIQSLNFKKSLEIKNEEE